MAKEFTQFPIPYEQDETNRVDVVQDLNLLSVILVGVGRRAITGTNFRKDLIKNRPAGVVNGNHRVLVYDEVRDVTEKLPADTLYVHPDHTGDVTSAGDGAQTIAAGAVTYPKIQEVAADRLLGRSDTIGTVEEIVVGNNLTLSAGRLDATASQYVHPDHTGDATSDSDGPTVVRAWRNQTLDDAFASVTDNQIPVYRTATGRWMLEEKPASGATPSLGELTDVVITGPLEDNEMLTWDDISSRWINNTYTEAGVATTTVGLSQFPNNSTTSAELRDLFTDETGDGAIVFADGPTLSAVNISSGTFDNATITLGADLDVGSSYISSSGANDVVLRPAAGQAIFLDHSSFPTTPGSNGEFLQTNGAGQLSWGVPPGGGDVVGPGSSTANALARYDGVSGKILKNSGWTLSDANVLVANGALQMQSQAIQGLDSSQNLSWSGLGCRQNLPTNHLYTFNVNFETIVAIDESIVTSNRRLRCTSTDSIKVPVGTTLQRPGTPEDGDLRINTDLGTTEIYRNAAWQDLEAGGGGGGTPGGVANSIQFNNGAGGFGGDSTFLYADGGIRGSHGPAGVTTNFVAGTGAGAALTTGAANVFIGVNAGSTSTETGEAVCIGRNAVVNATAALARSVCVGTAGSADGTRTVAIGYGVSAPLTQSIAVGYQATTTAINQFVCGSTSAPIVDVYFGRGATDADASGANKTYTIHGTGGSTTDNPGGDLILAPGKSTGAAAPAVVKIQGTGVGGTGAEPQDLSDIVWFQDGAIRGSYGAGGVTSNFVAGDLAASTEPANQSVCVGYNADAALVSSNRLVSIGWNAIAGAGSIGIGDSANASGIGGVAIGRTTTASATATVAVGLSASASASAAIAIGAAATNTQANSFVSGSSSYPVDDVYFGRGATDDDLSGANKTYTIHGTGGDTTDNPGGDLILAPGASTGAAAPASVKLQSTTPTTGSTPQSLVDTVTVAGGQMNVAGTATFTPQAATGTGTTTNIDWRNGNKFNFTFGAGNETLTFDDPIESGNFILLLKQDATGGRQITSWPTNVKWAGGVPPVLSTGANEIDIVSMYFDGTDYYGMVGLNFS